MDRIGAWVLAFFRFWYRFIIGDDWTMAAAVLIGLSISALLNASHVVAWWLIPMIVVVMLGISLRRAGARR